MELKDTPEQAAFRTEIRAWLNRSLPLLPPPPPIDDWRARRDYDTAWQRLQFDAGYAGIDWPPAYGGRGSSPLEQLIFLEESALAEAPYGAANFVGTKHAGPTLFTEGTPAQRERYLKPILRGDEVWCQGFSEPNAGSDLAGLQTRGVRDGDQYVLNGQKTWSSHSEVADHCEMLVRTSEAGRRHEGITFLIVPMDTPGIEVRPLRTIMGSADFAEIFLDDVRVPVKNRVGDENDGWRVAMVTLSFERGTTFVGELMSARVLLGELATLAKQDPHSGQAAWEGHSLRHEIAWLAAELDGLWALIRRTVSDSQAGDAPGLGASLFKLRFTELQQQLTDLVSRTAGRAALTMTDSDGIRSGHYAEERLRALSLTIAGGTSQIQRNIIAERMLGLPKG